MESSDDWLNFRERLIKMGIEPTDGMIEVLECLAGINDPITVKHIYFPTSRMDKVLDKVLDKVEDKMMKFQETHVRVKTKILSKKNNNRLKLMK